MSDLNIDEISFLYHLCLTRKHDLRRHGWLTLDEKKEMAALEKMIIKLPSVLGAIASDTPKA